MRTERISCGVTARRSLVVKTSRRSRSKSNSVVVSIPGSSGGGGGSDVLVRQLLRLQLFIWSPAVDEEEEEVEEGDGEGEMAVVGTRVMGIDLFFMHGVRFHYASSTARATDCGPWARLRR